jgi:hypothetical protein
VGHLAVTVLCQHAALQQTWTNTDRHDVIGSRAATILEPFVGVFMEIRTSIPRTLAVVGLVALITLICYVAARDNSAPAVVRVCAWAGAFFCACILVFYLFQLFRRSPTVLIDDSGVCDRRLGVGTIAWGDISSVAVTRIGYQRSISLWLRNEEQYLARLSAPRAWLMQPEIRRACRLSGSSLSD